ncbi:MAG: endonuclease/exonuclease/phosphatase family protein [Muribaculaceae bacterium]
MKLLAFTLSVVAVMMCSCGGSRGAVGQGGSGELTCASFNMRCDVPEQDSTCNWQQRMHRIARFITAERIAVVCSQELVGSMDAQLLNLLPGYAPVHASDGGVNAIFVDTAQVKVLKWGCFALAPDPDDFLVKGWDGAYARRAVWARLQHRLSGKELTVVNTHLDHLGAVARREGAALIAAKLPQVAQGGNVVVTGDFNDTDRGDAYATMIAAGLNDAAKTALQRQGAPYTWHNYGTLPMQQRSVIDFVMVSKAVQVVAVNVPSEQPGAMLSDHNPVVATLRIE